VVLAGNFTANRPPLLGRANRFRRHGLLCFLFLAIFIFSYLPHPPGQMSDPRSLPQAFDKFLAPSSYFLEATNHNPPLVLLVYGSAKRTRKKGSFFCSIHAMVGALPDYEQVGVVYNMAIGVIALMRRSESTVGCAGLTP